MGPQSVEYWEKWKGAELDAMAGLVREFNRGQDKYQVTMVPAGDWSSSPDLPRFLSAQEEGQPPDIIGLEDHQVADLAAQEALLPLEDFLEPGDLLGVGYWDTLLELAAFEKRRYGIPISADLVTLYVNRTGLRGTPFEGGVIPGGLPEFTEGLREVANRGRMGLVPTYPGWWPHAWAWFFGGSWADETGKRTPDRSENIRAYEWIASLRSPEALRMFPQPVNPIGARDPDPFLNGEVAMVLEGDWLVRRLLQDPEPDWLVAGMPTSGGEPGALVVADLLSIPRGARCVEGASAFLRFMLNGERLNALAMGHCKVSPVRDWPETFLASHPNPQIARYRAMIASARMFHEPRMRGWLEYRGRIARAFADIWSGRLDAAEALAAIQ